jgi:blue copper oxidase
MSPGEDVVLRSYPPDLGTNAFADRFNGGSDKFDVLQLRADDDLRPSPQIPERLAPAPDIDVEGAKTHTT